MILSDIRDEIITTVNDPSFTDDIVNGYINEVYQSSVARCMVPELKGVDVVTTTTDAFVDLSGVTGGFSGVLSRVYDGVQRCKIDILNSLEHLMDLGGNLTDIGDIMAVALEGPTLWYYPIPSVPVVLTVIYYKNPDSLSSDSDTPAVIPEFLHREILVNGACAIMFDKIEGGIEGLKVNTRARELAMERGIVRFREWLGKTRSHYITSQEPM